MWFYSQLDSFYQHLKLLYAECRLNIERQVLPSGTFRCPESSRIIKQLEFFFLWTVDLKKTKVNNGYSKPIKLLIIEQHYQITNNISLAIVQWFKIDIKPIFSSILSIDRKIFNFSILRHVWLKVSQKCVKTWNNKWTYITKDQTKT